MKLLAKYLATMSRINKIIVTAVIILSVLICYLGFALFFISEGELALAELQQSYKKEKICHEACSFWRQEQEQIVLAEIKNNPHKIEKRIRKYWQKKSEDIDFKVELLRIMSPAYGENNPPLYIKEYLEDPESDMFLLREIIANFNSSAVNNKVLTNNIQKRIKNSDNIENQVEAVKTLKSINNDGEIEKYFATIISSSSPEIKVEVIRNIGSIKNKRAIFTKDQLEKIRIIATAENTDIRVRQELVMLLGDYYLIFPKESASLWKEIYNNKLLDKISRSFCADSLNHLTGANLDLPEVSADEWANYYNQ